MPSFLKLEHIATGSVIGKRRCLALLAVLPLVLVLAVLPDHGFAAAPAAAPPGVATGPVTGLPVPRYVSLKADRVNLHQGPSKDQRTIWVYQRAGLPVEVTAEFENWRRIRDAEGAEGWVFHSLLSGRRTALVVPWEKKDITPLLERADDKAAVLARIEPNVIVTVKTCDGSWCRVVVHDIEGFVRQQKLWGVYPGEKVE